MQTQDQRETISENSQTPSILLEEDKPTGTELKSDESPIDVETPKPEIKEREQPQEQMQTLIAQMKELQERLQQSEGKVRDFEQKMEDKPQANAPTTKEFIGAKANEAKEFISDRSKEASALGLIIATACADACRATQQTLSQYRNLLMSFVAMIFVGFLVKHEVKQSNEIHSLTQTVQSLQHGLIQSQFQVENLNQNMFASSLQLDAL
jgi:flagellar biosynthesis chaperone FliJ